MAQPAPLNQNLPGKVTRVVTGWSQWKGCKKDGRAELSHPIPVEFLIPASALTWTGFPVIPCGSDVLETDTSHIMEERGLQAVKSNINHWKSHPVSARSLPNCSCCSCRSWRPILVPGPG